MPRVAKNRGGSEFSSSSKVRDFAPDFQSSKLTNLKMFPFRTFLIKKSCIIIIVASSNEI